MKESHTDKELLAVIQELLVQDGRLSAQPIDISVADGVATLAGTVQSYRRKLAALEITESIDGCRGVIDNLTVTPPGKMSDEEIAEAVRSSLDAHADITKEVVTVTAQDAVVTLRGNVATQWEVALAEDLALSSRGARKVHNLLAVAPSLEIEDEQLSRSIERAFSHTSGLQNTHVRVAVTGVTASLSGHVGELWQKKRAEQVARRFQVVVVNNDISLK